MALRSKVVDFVRLYLLNNANQAGTVGEIAVVKYEMAIVEMRIFVDMIDAVGVEA